MSNNIIKVVAYARFSSDNQRSESIDAQLRAITEYCKRNNFIIIDTYIDEAKSATSDKRDSFLKMIDDSNNKEFNYVIVHKLDRFSRNRYDSAIYKKRLKDNNVKVLSVLENIDDSPESIILESMLEGMSEYYSKNLAREVKKGLNENALKCQHNGGLPPLGLDVNPETKQYIINEFESQTVKIIFNMFNQGYGYGKIVDALNLENRKTKIGRNFSKNSIHDILQNEKYNGTYVYGKRLSKRTGNRVFKDDRDIVRIANAFPKIIDDDLWDSCQSKIKNKIKPRKAKNNTRNYILTGFLRCSCCGSPYVGGSYVGGRNKQKYPVYVCSSRKNKKDCKAKSIRADLLEETVINAIHEYCLTDNNIDSIIQKMEIILEEEKNKYSDVVKQIKTKITSNENKQQKIIELYYDGDVTRETFTQEYNRLINENKLLVSDLEMHLNSGTLELNRELILKTILNLKNNPGNLRILIETFVKTININNDEVEISLTFPKKTYSKKTPISSTK